MLNKILLSILFLIIILFLFFQSSYKNNFQIIKNIPFKNQSIAIIEEYETTNYYYLSNNDLSIFKNGKFKPFLKCKRIYADDIQLIIENNKVIINIKKGAYETGDILHFQNLIYDKSLKIYKIFLNII